MSNIVIVGYVVYPTMILLCSYYDVLAIGLLVLPIGTILFAYKRKTFCL